MERFFIVIVLGALVTSVIVLTMRPTQDVAVQLTEKNWRFKMVTSENPSTLDHLSILYGKAGYRFFSDHTYNGILFELPVSGTWEVFNDTLFLNRGTLKEETYKFTFSSSHNLVLQPTKEGSKVFIEFEMDNT